MAIHYYHCTDGIDLILDRAGRETRDFGELRPQAISVADRLMREVPGYADWERWSVYVYDEKGQVEIVPFTEAAQTPKPLPEPRRAQAKDVKRRRPKVVGRSSH